MSRSIFAKSFYIRHFFIVEIDFFLLVLQRKSDTVIPTLKERGVSLWRNKYEVTTIISCFLLHLFMILEKYDLPNS